MPQPDREVRGLRNDLREACATVAGELQQLLEATGKGNAIGEVLEVKLAQLHGDLTAEGGLGTRFVGQAAPVQTENVGGAVEVSNPTDVSGLENAQFQTAETVDSTGWAIFGMLVGFGLLGVIWKLVRP